MKRKIHPYHARQHMMASNFEVFHYSDRKLDQVCLHHHDFYECYSFISGDVTYLIEGRAYSLQPGDLVLINSTELHQAIINNKDVPYERMILWIDREFLRSLSSAHTDLAHCFEAPDKENVLRAGLELQQAIKSTFLKLLGIENYTGVGGDLLSRAYLIELLVHIAIIQERGSIPLDVDIRKSPLIDRVIEYINNRIDEEIRIDELADVFYLSKYHLIREFKKHSGTTIHKYIIQKKLIQAKELILQNKPITEVYIECGFGDYSNFFRAFKNEYGVTPKQFFELMAR